MTSNRLHLAVGLFMTIGITVATVVIIWLGASSILDRGAVFVTYFDESVQGLSVDSPVKYRGVPVGRVSGIRIAPDARLIAVELAISKDHAPEIAKRREHLVASLSNVGITGAMFIELDNKHPQEPDLSSSLNFTPGQPVIASRPSDIKKLFRELDTIAKQVQLVDFPAISRQTLQVLSQIEHTLAAARIGEIAAETLGMVRDVRATVSHERLARLVDDASRAAHALRQAAEAAQKNVDQFGALAADARSVLAENRPHLTASLAELAHSAQTLQAVLHQTQQILGNVGGGVRASQDNLITTLESLQGAAANLEQLTSQLKTQPSLLLFAAPPKNQPTE
jgi:ABC-type transporter Mla subunit MlaD